MKILSVVKTDEATGGYGQAELLAKNMKHDFMYCTPIPTSKTLIGESVGITTHYPSYNMVNTIKELDPDILLVHSLSTELSNEIEAIKKYTRVVYVAHVQLYEHFLMDMYRGYLPMIYRFMANSDLIICLSNDQENIINEFTNTKTRVIPPAIDYAHYSNLEAEPVSNTFTIAGRLFPVKNHFTIIAAMRHTIKKYPDAFLSIYGDGPLANDYAMMIAHLGLTENIGFFGHLGHDQLIGELCTSKALISPSFIENNSVSVIEAKALGLPVINGNSFSPREYADKMVDLIENYDKYKKIALNNRVFAKENDIEEISLEYMRILEEVL